MNHIGVLNFTRMGDLIQCGPLLDSLREKDSEARLTLIVLENFVETARRLPMVDEVIAFPLDHFVPHLDRRRISLSDLYVKLADFASSLRAKGFDRFYNLAHTRLSAALTWLTHAPTTYGLTYDSTGHLLVTHPWINYYFCVTMDRTWNPFNLVEMYLPIAENIVPWPKLRFRLLPEDESEATSLLKEAGWDRNSTAIAFQMGAADERRQWPVASFAELARQLIASNGVQIILLGTTEDSPRSRSLIEMIGADRILDLTGKTSIGVLAAVLKQCHVLVSNDTGTIHLAAAVETPTVGIYLGPAAAKDTGPYGDGHLLLESHLPCAPCVYQASCAHRACHEAIQPSDVAAAVLCQIEKTIPTLAEQWDSSRLRIRRTQVAKDGQMRLVPLMKLPLERQTLMHSFYRVFWRLLLGSRPHGAATPANAWIAERNTLAEHYRISDPAELLTSDDEQAIRTYEEIAARAQYAIISLQRELTSARPSLSSLRDGTLELARCDRWLEQVEEVFPAWAPLAQFVCVLRGNVADDSPAGLATACHEVYGALVRGSGVLRALWKEVTLTQMQEARTIHA